MSPPQVPPEAKLRRRLDFLDVFRPVKWIGLVFGRYLAVSGQDWVINDDSSYDSVPERGSDGSEHLHTALHTATYTQHTTRALRT